LFFSGISLLGEGKPALEAVLGGHVSAAHWHRWIGFGLVGLAALVLALRPAASRKFLAHSIAFRSADLGWFVTYPSFLVRPRRHSPARHEGHFDPGQRAMNLVIVLSLIVLSATGIIMSFPQRVTPMTFAWSLRIHRAATWVLAGAVGGHVLVASGILRAYRGVWRAMHGDGRVRGHLADRLWPRWTEEQRESIRARGPGQGGAGPVSG
jgi:formate dehydrogenase subunit gamma